MAVSPMMLKEWLVGYEVFTPQMTQRYVRRDGSTSMLGDLDLNSHKVTNLANPVNNGDAMNKGYADLNYAPAGHSHSYENPLTFNYPLTRSVDTIGFGYNTTNLKLTANELNTIQDISTTSSPTFAGLTLTEDLTADGYTYTEWLTTPLDTDCVALIGGTNILTDEQVSFESGTDGGWTYSGCTGVNYADAYHGSKCIQNTATGAVHIAQYRSVLSETSAGQTYTISAWLKAGNAGSLGDQYQLALVGDTSGATLGTPITLTYNWQRATCTKTFSASDTTTRNAYAMYAVANASIGDIVLVDAIQLERGSSASVFGVAQTLNTHKAFTYDGNSLSVLPDTDTTHYLGRLKIGVPSGGTADYVAIAHYDNLTATNFAFMQNYQGVTYINAANTKWIDFAINGAEQLWIDTVGISFAGGTKSVVAATGYNLNLRMGDAVGVNKIIFQSSTPATVASIDSYGNYSGVGITYSSWLTTPLTDHGVGVVGGVNLLNDTDASCEASIGSWYAVARCTVAQGSEGKHGSKCLAATYASAGGSARAGLNVTSVVTAGHTYTFTSWIKAGNAGAVGHIMTVQVWGDVSGYTGSGNLTLTTDWQALSVTKTFGATDTSMLVFCFWGELDNGDIVLTDCHQLERGSTASKFGISTTLNNTSAFTYDGNSLSVLPDTDTVHTFGRAKIGFATSGTADYAYFGHYDSLTSTNYALAQGATGDTYINAATGKYIYFQFNNVTQFVMNGTVFSAWGAARTISAAAGYDLNIKMGDTVGANSIIFQNSTPATVAQINSYGAAAFGGVVQTNTQLYVTKAFTPPAAYESDVGQYVYVTSAPTAASAAYLKALMFQARYAGTYNQDVVYGIEGHAVNYGTATVGDIRGAYLYTLNRGTGTNTNSYGVYAESCHGSGSTGATATGSATGVYSLVGIKASSDGTITNAYGVSINAVRAAGTITNLYGLYIASSIAGAATLNYAIYSATASPCYLSPDADVCHALGRAKIGYNGANADMASFFHYDMSGAGNYALLQKADGTTYLNAASSKVIYFCVAGSQIWKVDSTSLTSMLGSAATISAAAGYNLNLKMGDALGVNKISFTDSADAEVGYVNSDGNSRLEKLGLGVNHDATYVLALASGQSIYSAGAIYMRGTSLNLENTKTILKCLAAAPAVGDLDEHELVLVDDGATTQRLYTKLNGARFYVALTYEK